MMPETNEESEGEDEEERSSANDVEAGQTFLSRVPQFQRPGVEAVLRRHKHRVRSMSVSSSSEFDPMIANEMSRSPSHKAGGVNITQSKYAVGTYYSTALYYYPKGGKNDDDDDVE